MSSVSIPKSSRVFAVVAAMLLVAFVFGSYGMDPMCSYCGAWVPFEKSPEQPHLAGEQVLITESTVALPGCAAVPSSTMLLAEELQGKSNDSRQAFRTFLWHGGILKAVIRTESQAVCKRPLPDIPEGALIEIAVRQSGHARGERLFLAQFSPSEFELLRGSYIAGSLPSVPTEKTRAKERTRPKETASWRLIRKDYKVCDEGSDDGAVVCAAARLYEADGRLNAEWRQLMGVVPRADREILVSEQRKWLEGLGDKCRYTNEGRWSDRWIIAFETNCRADNLSARSEQLRALYECIASGNKKCQTL